MPAKPNVEPIDIEVTFKEEGLEASALITQTDLHGVITYASKAYRQMTKYSKEELVGSPHSIVRHPDMPAAAFKQMWDVIKSDKMWEGYVKNLRKDGKYYWVIVRIEPIFDEKVLNFIAMIFEQKGADAWYDLEIKDLLYPGSGLNVGDVVVATREVFADFGRKHKTHCSFFSDKIAGKFSCNLNHPFTEKLIYFLETGGFSPVTGTFASVCMASYHIERAKIIENRFSAIAENMEGFGVARAGEKKGIYIAEIRIISNLLKEPEKDWDFKKAGTKLKEVWKWLAKNLK